MQLPLSDSFHFKRTTFPLRTCVTNGMPGTDVDRLFLDVLPRLKSGTLVHVHDMLLPDAYPADWEWRGYNEQIVVGALLQGGGYEIVFSSHYAATRMAASLGALADLPLRAGVVESSLWLRKR